MAAVSVESERTAGGVPPLLNANAGKGTLLLAGVLAALGLIVVAALYFFDPARHAFYPQCLLYKTTGLMCPGCGSLRALHQLMHGDLQAAFRLNALLVLLVPVVAVLVARWCLNLFSPNRARTRVPQWAIWCALAGIVVFGVVRNTPLAYSLGLAP